MGGFITPAARLARANFRPLFLPAEGQPTTMVKRFYDFAGCIVSLLILNYVTPPFMLLTWNDSITAWSRLGWYGHVIIMGTLVFFYVGGAKFFRNLHKQMGIAPPAKKGNSTTGTETPVAEKTFQLPPSIDQVIPPPK